MTVTQYLILAAIATLGLLTWAFRQAEKSLRRLIREIELQQDGVCEHGVLMGDWCHVCNAQYKSARLDPDNGNGESF